MIFSCDKRVDCEGSDFPLLNASSEGPDLPQYTSVGFCCNGQQVWAFSLASQIDADDALQRLMTQNCPTCIEERKYCADASCPDGTLLATYCLPTSQAEADTLAEAHREAMLPFCDTPEQLFSATCACPDGSQSVTMYSEISEEDAMAACESVPRDCFPPCNEEQICRVVCPDGTEFFYVVPACTIYAATVAEANALAYALACQRAAELRICLGPIDPCTCYGDPYSSTINATGATAPPASWEIVSSNLPPGLSATLTPDGYGLVISGHPTANGVYTFSVKATTAGGSYAIRGYSISVLQITTTALPDFSAGVAYSYQLAAAGGSGNYAWRLVSGTLPDGLSLSITGLISGTPTGTAVAATLVFEVVDPSCEVISRGFYAPKVKLETNATTRVQTKRGYPEYVLSTGKLYKKITWTGELTQTGFAEGYQIAGAQYVWFGSSEINLLGVFTSHHNKNRYVMCSRPIYPLIGGALSEILSTSEVSRLIGYCWWLDPYSCPSCPPNSEDWIYDGNFQTGSPTDPPQQMLLNPAAVTKTPTTYQYSGVDTADIEGIEGANAPGGSTATIHLESTGTFGAVLSEEFTDAEAVASEQTYHSSLPQAETLPEYLRTQAQEWLTNLYSRYTEVTYSFKCSGLIIGQAYIIRYELLDIIPGTTALLSQSTTFVASAASQVITGTIPTPAAGHTTKIQNVSIIYA